MVEGGTPTDTLVRHRVSGTEGVLPRGGAGSGDTDREFAERVRRHEQQGSDRAKRIHIGWMPPHRRCPGHIEQYRGGHATKVAYVRARLRRGHIHWIQRSGNFFFSLASLALCMMHFPRTPSRNVLLYPSPQPYTSFWYFAELRYSLLARSRRGTVDEEGSQITHLHPVGTGQECPNEEERDHVPIVRVRPQDQYRNHDRGSRDIRHVAVYAEESQAQLVFVELGLR